MQHPAASSVAHARFPCAETKEAEILTTSFARLMVLPCVPKRSGGPVPRKKI